MLEPRAGTHSESDILESKQSAKPISPIVVAAEASEVQQDFAISSAPQIHSDIGLSQYALHGGYHHDQVHADRWPATSTGDIYSPHSSPTGLPMAFPTQCHFSVASQIHDIHAQQPYISPLAVTDDPSCSCLKDPRAGTSLVRQLENTIALFRKLVPEHATEDSCIVYNRMLQLSDLIQ